MRERERVFWLMQAELSFSRKALFYSLATYAMMTPWVRNGGITFAVKKTICGRFITVGCDFSMPSKMS